MEKENSKFSEEEQEEIVDELEEQYLSTSEKFEKIGFVKKTVIILSFNLGFIGLVLSLMNFYFISRNINFRIYGYDYLNSLSSIFLPFGSNSLLILNLIFLSIFAFLAYLDSHILIKNSPAIR